MICLKKCVTRCLSGLGQPPGKSSIFSACMGLNLIACNGIISAVSIPLIVTVVSETRNGFWKRRHNFSPLNHCLSPFQNNSNSFHSDHVLIVVVSLHTSSHICLLFTENRTSTTKNYCVKSPRMFCVSALSPKVGGAFMHHLGWG